MGAILTDCLGFREALRRAPFASYSCLCYLEIIPNLEDINAHSLSHSRSTIQVVMDT
ncbi:hypothetical protein MASR2M78_15300 [Treponema sp.]